MAARFREAAAFATPKRPAYGLAGLRYGRSLTETEEIHCGEESAIKGKRRLHPADKEGHRGGPVQAIKGGPNDSIEVGQMTISKVGQT